jgi:hypothetical protein
MLLFKMKVLSRDTYYLYKAAIDNDGVQALFDSKWRKPNYKNRIDPDIEQIVVEYATGEPAHGQVRVSNELRKLDTFKSLSGVSLGLVTASSREI